MDAEELYKGAEVLIQEEDEIPITTPIIEPVKDYKFDLKEESVPKLNVDLDYMSSLGNKPERIRNVSIIGPFHSGKTSFVDLMV